MRSPWTARIVAAGAVASGLIAFVAQAQEAKTKTQTKARDRDDAPAAKESPAPSSRFKTRQALNEHYEKEFAELDRKRIADLAALAPALKGAEAESAYADAFNLAVTRDQYDAAEKAAEAFLRSGEGSPQTKALASFVDIVASSNRGEYDQAVGDLDAFLKGLRASAPAPAATNDPAAKAANAASTVDPNLLFAVGEAFLQRLIKAREYDAARKVCTTFVDDAMAPAVKAHFAARLARINMLGKPAPALSGTDVDGKKVGLADYKGKVVLVDFWATWAPPCVAQIPYYNALQSKYGAQGFQIVGVNVDGSHQAARDKAAITAGVRRFLLAMRVTWPSVINGTAANDYAKAFGVTDVPSNFLIDRDGKVLQVELSDIELDKAIETAVGGAKAADKASERASEKASDK